jgi:hypothetical protein
MEYTRTRKSAYDGAPFLTDTVAAIATGPRVPPRDPVTTEYRILTILPPPALRFAKILFG